MTLIKTYLQGLLVMGQSLDQVRLTTTLKRVTMTRLHLDPLTAEVTFTYTNEDGIQTSAVVSLEDIDTVVTKFGRFLKCVGFKDASITDAMDKYYKDNAKDLQLYSRPFTSLPAAAVAPYGTSDELTLRYLSQNWQQGTYVNNVKDTE
jgi:hypothetical protein